jgi:hypothetical protein
MMLVAISLETELSNHERSMLLDLTQLGSEGSLAEGFTMLPSIKPNLFLATSAIIIDRLHVIDKIITMKRMRNDHRTWIISMMEIKRIG